MKQGGCSMYTCWHSQMCLILNQSLETHPATVMRCTINSSTQTHCLQSNSQVSWPQRPNSVGTTKEAGMQQSISIRSFFKAFLFLC